MSDKILDFAAAGAVADREFRFVTHPMKWTLAREAALEAQAQARLAAVQDRVDKLKKERIEYQDTVSGVCAWAEKRGAPRFTQANRASVLAALDHALTMQTTPRPTAPDMGTWMERAEIAEAKLADYEWSAQTCAVPVPLRAAHQRLKDAVVAAAMKLKLWADDPNHSEAGTTLRFELYQECTALAAFEAQHPEVRG